MQEHTLPQKNFTSRSGVWGLARRYGKRPAEIPQAFPRWNRLMQQREMITPVFLPAVLVGLRADRFLFAVADGLELVRRNAGLDQGLLRSGGATFTERQVVHAGTALVAIAFDEIGRAH